MKKILLSILLIVLGIGLIASPTVGKGMNKPVIIKLTAHISHISEMKISTESVNNVPKFEKAELVGKNLVVDDENLILGKFYVLVKTNNPGSLRVTINAEPMIIGENNPSRIDYNVVNSSNDVIISSTSNGSVNETIAEVGGAGLRISSTEFRIRVNSDAKGFTPGTYQFASPGKHVGTLTFTLTSP